MADPAGAVEVKGTVTANGKVGRRSAEALVAEIERTREDLARTIDSLADLVSPADNLRRLRERGLEKVSRPEVQLATVAVGVALVGFAVYRLWRRRK